MIVVIAVAALVVIGLAVALALGALPRLSVHRTDPVSSAGGRPLPAGEFMSDDVADLRFDVTVRGYRMDQVDEAVDRLRGRIAELEDMVGGGPALPGAFDHGSIAVFPTVGPATKEWSSRVGDAGRGDRLGHDEHDDPRA